MNRYARAFRLSMLATWVLVTPPTPLGTSLPPLSEWSRVSDHETAAECEGDREKLRKAAKATAARDASASALDVAAALGRLQSRCIEIKSPEPVAAPAATAPAAPAAPAATPAKK